MSQYFTEEIDMELPLSSQEGGHSYHKSLSCHCKFGCGCWVGIQGTNFYGPHEVNPLGKCPKNPKNKNRGVIELEL